MPSLWLHIPSAFLSPISPQGLALEMPPSPRCPPWLPHPPSHLCSPDRSCFMRPLLALGSTGKKSLNQVISGSGLPLAAQSIVAVRVRSTTFSWGPMSMLGKPGGSWSSEGGDMGRTGRGPRCHMADPAAGVVVAGSRPCLAGAAPMACFLLAAWGDYSHGRACCGGWGGVRSDRRFSLRATLPPRGLLERSGVILMVTPGVGTGDVLNTP